MAPGEIFVAAFLQVLLDRLTSRDILNFAHLLGVRIKLKKWTATLQAFQLVLCDAEVKQLTSEAVRLWLDDLKDLAYDMEDILIKFSTEMLGRKLNGKHGHIASKVRSLIPPVKFNFNVTSEIKGITERLLEISERKIQLGLRDIKSPTTTLQRPLNSVLLDGPLVGRDEDKRMIVELLAEDEPTTINFHVIAIVGMSGIGKTTLARFVYNRLVTEQFNPKVWVSVPDEFNPVRLTKAILESITSQHCPLEEFSNVQDILIKELTGKKFLIVLDDVRSTCDYVKWTNLQSSFHVGALGSRIIVTTRDASVAKMMGVTKTHYLECMSDGDCLKVFQQHAFLNVDNQKPPNSELLLEKILAKCSGLPLAAKVLGGLLRFKEIDEWEEILNNKLWSFSNKSGILPVLKLSYHYLPSHLKRCFAYCSIFPNAYEFEDKQLILLWMAEGLIQQPKDSRRLEDLGAEYFQELLSRSLFQKSSQDDSKYVIHDHVSDLARWVAGEICFRLEDKLDCYMEFRRSPKSRHSSYISSKFDGVEKFEIFFQVECLRTFLPLTLSQYPDNYLTRKVTFDLLPKLQYLRVLSLNGYRITELPESIGKLKFIQYLDLSRTLIESLPESISTLYNLQTLLLESCINLKALPAKMKNLINLRHLNNLDVPFLERMPQKLSRLTNLQTLTNFVVGTDSESGVREIGPLLHLRGTLHLTRLENVIDARDAEMAGLSKKEELDALLLKWSSKREMESDFLVLDMLQPHRNLQELTIMGYGGLRFSTWIGNPLFSNMVRVSLYNCTNCQILPTFGQLPSIKELHILGMSGVESVGHEFYGEGSLPFPVLEILEFEDMQNWKEWLPCELDHVIGVFPRLKVLFIDGCPKLEGRLPENLDSLTKLEIRDCDQLVVSIANYKELCVLCVHNCKGVVHRSVIDFDLPECMRLSNISELRLLTDGIMRGLTKVKDLEITDCEELTSSWQNENRLLQHLISLRRLVIEGNSRLVQLHHLKSLRELHIYECPSLVSFSEIGFPLSLELIKIRKCESLTYFARYQIPPSLRRIEIKRCPNLKSLVKEVEDSSFSLMQEEAYGLEFLSIFNCPSLTSISFRGQLPRALKHLRIDVCEQLESITDRFDDNTWLEQIFIDDCPNLKSLPEGLCYLTNLQELIICGCGSLVSFPEGGLPRRAPNLRHIEISDCYKLEALPEGMHNLNSLQVLEISHSEGLIPFSEKLFPSNLISLRIQNIKSCQPLFENGLHRLISLRELDISGEDPDLVSFPPEMLLPRSLVKLKISGFPNLRNLSSKGLLVLTSLESLEIWFCPELASIPERSLPISLTQLHIVMCPLLEKSCKPREGQYWPYINQIPYIKIGGKETTAPNFWCLDSVPKNEKEAENACHATSYFPPDVKRQGISR